MPADQCEIASRPGKDPRDQLAEFSVPDNDDPVLGADLDVLQNAARRRQRLREYRLPVGYGVRNRDQVFGRQALVCKRAVAVVNTQHGSSLAMTWVPLPAQPAFAAPGVDFSDDPFPELACVG
jgi:hypothetical protein